MRTQGKVAEKKNVPKKTMRSTKKETVQKKETPPEKEPAPKVKLVGIEELAKLVDVTERRIQQIEQEGVIKSEPKKNNKDKREYDFAKSIVALVRYFRNKADSRKSGDSEDMEAEKLRFLIAKREKEELLLEELKGDLHRTADIERVMGAAFTRLRINALAIPMGVAPLLREKTDVNEIAEPIYARLCRAFNELATVDLDKLLDEADWSDTGEE